MPQQCGGRQRRLTCILHPIRRGDLRAAGKIAPARRAGYGGIDETRPGLMMRTDDLRISRVRPLLSPAILAEEITVTTRGSECIALARRTIEAILDGRDPRLLAVVGPCSIHDTRAAIEYAQRLRELAERVYDCIFLVMRV